MTALLLILALLSASGPAQPGDAASVGAVGTVMVGGAATWYDAPAGTAAAGPALRDLLGPDWRGQAVTVSHGSRSVVVVLRDWCACGPRAGHETLLDLSRSAFARLAPLSVGVIEVSVEPHGAIDLPPTDEAEPVWLSGWAR